MMNGKILLITTVVLGCVLLIGSNCKNATQPTPTPTKPLELIQPKGGEHFKVGDTVQISWKANDSTYISSVEVLLLPGFPDYPLGGGGSFPLDTTIKWIIDSTQVSTSCYIKICDYIDPTNPHDPPDSSGRFSITLH